MFTPRRQKQIQVFMRCFNPSELNESYTSSTRSRDELCRSVNDNFGRKPTMFVRKAIIHHYNFVFVYGYTGCLNKVPLFDLM